MFSHWAVFFFFTYPPGRLLVTVGLVHWRPMLPQLCILFLSQVAPTAWRCGTSLSTDFSRKIIPASLQRYTFCSDLNLHVFCPSSSGASVYSGVCLLCECHSSNPDERSIGNEWRMTQEQTGWWARGVCHRLPVKDWAALAYVRVFGLYEENGAPGPWPSSISRFSMSIIHTYTPITQRSRINLPIGLNQSFDPPGDSNH